MKNLILLITCLALSSSLLADNPQTEMKEKRIVIKTSGDTDGKSLSEILTWAKSKTGGEHGGNIQNGNVEVYVIADDDGEVIVEKNGERRHGIHKAGIHKRTGTHPMAHVMAFAESHHRSPHSRHKSMSEGAANCILKNISKVNSDSASHLLKQACMSLNPMEKTSGK